MEVIKLIVLLCGINGGQELTNCEIQVVEAKPTTSYEQCQSVAQGLPGADASNGRKVILALCSKDQGA